MPLGFVCVELKFDNGLEEDDEDDDEGRVGHCLSRNSSFSA
jgi:hypothetical protein